MIKKLKDMFKKQDKPFCMCGVYLANGGRIVTCDLHKPKKSNPVNWGKQSNEK